MLTGRTRYRIGWRKKLVMQVEYWRLQSAGWVLCGYGRQWCDATIEDMQAIERGDVQIEKPAWSRQPPPPKRPGGAQEPPVRNPTPQTIPCPAPDAPGGEKQ